MRTLFLSLLLAAFSSAAYAPRDSASSVDEWLHDVWTQGANRAYVLYMGKPHVPMSLEARQAFPQAMLDLAATPHIAAMVLQKAKFEVYAKDHLPPADQIGSAFFVHFRRSDAQGARIAERIYINVHPDHAAEVMRFVVTELMAGPGVMIAKVAGPAGLESRADSIVIYSRSLEDVDWELGRLKEFQSSHSDCFLKELPAATRPRLIGVSTAAEPANPSDSFGSYISRIATAAMNPKPADFAAFRQRVREMLTADGVDPDHPDRLTRRP